MTIKTKGLIAISFGAICVALGLIYGVSGQMQSSISTRSANIARWEAELVKDQKDVAARIAEADKLGDKKDATPAEREEFARMVDRVERDTGHLRSSREMIEYERGRRKEMIIITVAFVIVGALSILIGALLRRRRAS